MPIQYRRGCTCPHRPSAQWRCYQTGAMIGGRVDWFGSYTGPCEGVTRIRGATWYNVTVTSRVYRNTTVLLDGRPIVQPIIRHQRRGHVGVVVTNGWDNTVYFKQLAVRKTTSGRRATGAFCVALTRLHFSGVINVPIDAAAHAK